MPGEIRAGVRRLFRLAIRRRAAIDEQMDEELAFHLEARIEQLMARGLNPDEARAEALRRLGNPLDEIRSDLHHSAERKERRMQWRERWDDFRQDIRYAARGLVKRPGFAAVAVLTLAIGIGANTAIFSTIDALLLRPLPFREPQRLATIMQTGPEGPNAVGAGDTPWSWKKYTVFRDAQQSFAELGLYADRDMSITGVDPLRLRGEVVSARYLATLGIAPHRGHDFPRETDVAAGGPKQVLISDRLWRSRFQARPDVLGSVLHLDAESFEIVGVMPPGFSGLSGRADVWVAITAVSTPDELEEAWSLQWSMIGRLKPGVILAGALADTKLAAHRVWQATSEASGTLSSGGSGEWSAVVRHLDDTRAAPVVKRSLFVLSGAVGFVLLIACVNLANLLLGRAAARQQEIAIRLAIGAGRGRLIRLLLTESVLLALLGGMISVLVAAWGTHVLSTMNPVDTLRAQGMSSLGAAGFATIRLDQRALLFTFAVSLVVGVVFGLVPALQATRPELTGTLKGGDRGSRRASSGRLGLSRSTLVVAEVALALVLLAGAGLMLRSLGQLLGINPGFDAERLLTFRLAIPPSEHPRDSLPGFYDQLLARVRALPGVAEVGMADCPPLAGGCNGTILTFPDRPPAPQGQNAVIGVHFVSPTWFATARVPLLRGRMFTDADRIGTPRVILIGEAAAKKFWPNQDPIGKPAKVYQGGFHQGATIIGVVGDVRFGTIDSLPRPDSYISTTQAPRSFLMIFARTTDDPNGLIPAVRHAVREYMPAYPVYDIQPMTSRVAIAMAQARFSAGLLTLFAGVALVLAIMGIYGVMAFAVVQRTREIGIRMALGADRGRVLGLIVREGALLAATGTAVGLAGALALTRVLRSMLFGVSTTDLPTYVVIVLVLAGATLLASWVPARRAARIDPMIAVRAE